MRTRNQREERGLTRRIYLLPHGLDRSYPLCSASQSHRHGHGQLVVRVLQGMCSDFKHEDVVLAFACAGSSCSVLLQGSEVSFDAASGGGRSLERRSCGEAGEIGVVLGPRGLVIPQSSTANSQTPMYHQTRVVLMLETRIARGWRFLL